MRKLIATGNGWSLYQTGFETVYEGSYAEETFPSGYAEDANGNQTPVRNLFVVLEKADWTLVEPPEYPTEKGRQRKFQSRSEAARYAAHIRWGTTPTEQSGERTIASNGVPLEPTWDVNEAILTGRPYAPFLEENFPPEVKEALKVPFSENALSTPSVEQYAIVQQYFKGHLDPSAYSEDVQKQMLAVTGTGGEDMYRGNLPRMYYSNLAHGESIKHDEMVNQIANRMANEAFKRSAADTWGERYNEDAMTVTKALQASPTKAISVSVSSGNLESISQSGRLSNQFETGSSYGMLDLDMRAGHEAISYGVHPATLPQARPIYGNFQPAGIRHTSASGAGQYGDVQLVLKPETHKRATFTVQDSLGMVRRASPVEGEITRPQIFPNLSLGKSNPAHPLKHLRRVKAGKQHEYSEAQIHGGVKLSDVSHIVYNGGWREKNPKPPATVVLFARKHGLKIVSAEYPEQGEKFGVINLDGPEVQKAFDAIVAELTDVVLKAKSFSGDRSAAASYAARVRWGNRNKQTPSLPDGWRVESERQNNSGSTTYILEGPEDEGGTLSALVRAGEDGVSVELNRVGGENHRKIGEITTSALPEMGHDNLPPNTFAIDFIGVHADDRRKGYATLMLEIARAKSYKGYDIQHSTLLTDDGAEWASATKSFDDVEKGRPRKFQTRTEAARYAAQIRWGNRNGDATGGLPPHMQAMKDEAESIRAELAEIVADMDLSRLQRSSPRYRKASWTDDKGAVQIDTNTEEMIPSPRLADAHDRVIALGTQMAAEAGTRAFKAYADDPSTPLEVHQAKAFQDVVSEIVPVGGKPTFSTISGATKSMEGDIEGALLEATSKMPTSWVEASAMKDLQVMVGTSYDNPFFRATTSSYEELCFPPPAQIQATYGKVVTRSAAHEFTHMVEHRKPAIKALEVAFMTSRTTGFSLDAPNAPLRSRMTSTLRDVRSRATTGSKTKPVIEISQDKFTNLYSGRHYDDNTKFDRRAVYADTPNNNRSGTRSAFEVLSTGMEMYVSGNVGNYDDNHMAFVLGTLVTT